MIIVLQENNNLPTAPDLEIARKVSRILSICPQPKVGSNWSTKNGCYGHIAAADV